MPIATATVPTSRGESATGGARVDRTQDASGGRLRPGDAGRRWEMSSTATAAQLLDEGGGGEEMHLELLAQPRPAIGPRLVSKAPQRR